MENIGQYRQLVATYAIAIGTKIVAAIIFWIVDRGLPGANAGTDDYCTKPVTYNPEKFLRGTGAHPVLLKRLCRMLLRVSIMNDLL